MKFIVWNREVGGWAEGKTGDVDWKRRTVEFSLWTDRLDKATAFTFAEAVLLKLHENPDYVLFQKP